MSQAQRIDIEPGSILGLNYNGGHDSSVSVVGPDGAIAFACSLERVSRRKQDGRFPQALLDCIDFSRIRACALPSYTAADTPDGPTGQRFHSLRHLEQDYPILSFPAAFDEALDGVPVPKVFVGHELAHAASGYFLSQFSDAAVLSYDAGMYNEPWFGGVFNGVGPELQAVEYFPCQTNAKIASLYAVVTGLLGYKPLRHEGKLTGLAAYAAPDPACVEAMHHLITNDYSQLESVARWIHAFDPEIPPQFVVDTAARARVRQLFGSASAATIAASLQHVTEVHVLEIVARIKDAQLSNRLCLAGGLFANVRLNQRIHELWGGELFVAPPMGDDGAGLGAALYEVYSSGSAVFPMHRPTMYQGFSFAASDVRAALDQQGLVYDTPDHPAATLAELLAKGQSVGVFTGAMEFGPRALGHRSILAPAIDRTINETLNAKLRRTEFMPFAPVTRAEDAPRAYRQLDGIEHTAEFMTVTVGATSELANSCPAVVHVDGTARPQLVYRDANPFLHDVLTEYERLTGLVAIINTSFNIHEEPIVCTPEEAVRGFIEARLDYLYAEGFVISRERNLSRIMADRQDSLPEPQSGRSDDQVLIDYLWQELHYVRGEAQQRLSLIEHLHAECERYRENNRELQVELEALRPQVDVPPQPPDQPIAAALAEDVVPISLAEPGVMEPAPAELAVILGTLQRVAARVEVLLRERDQVPMDVQIQQRLTGLEQAKALAEAAAEARLRVIEEQQRALDHYRYWRLRERFQRLMQPRLGVLYQYPARKLNVPRRYTQAIQPLGTPSLSIVTPSYNQGQFIEATLRSVLGQHYPRLEYIVQDGASDDDTLKVIDRFGDSLASVESAPDRGFAHALNQAFARTSGEIMAYLNSDDLILPGALQYVANYFVEHPEIDVVYGHRIIVDEYGGEIGRWVLPPHEDEVLSWADYVPQETLFWRRKIWDAAGGSIDESFRFAVDWDLLIRFREAGARMARLPRFVGAFRVHPHQKTSAQMADVGIQEMDRLRERVHGRSVTRDEIHHALQPYLRKHVAYHKLYRAGLLRY